MRRLAPVVAGLLLFTACKIRVELDTTLNGDGSGRLTFAVAFDEKFRQAMEQFTEGFGDQAGGGSGNLLDDMEDQAPEGWDVERFTEGEYGGARISRDFESLEDLQQALSETEQFGAAGDDLGAEGGAQFGQAFDVQRDGDTFTVTLGENAFQTPTTVEGQDQLLGGANPFGALEFEFVVSIDMPGKVLDHNADDEDGGRLTWRFDNESPPKAIRAVSDASQSAGGGSALPVVLLLVVATAGIGALLVARNRRAAVAGPTSDETPLPPPPPPPAPPPPPPPPPD